MSTRASSRTGTLQRKERERTMAIKCILCMYVKYKSCVCCCMCDVYSVYACSVHLCEFTHATQLLWDNPSVRCEYVLLSLVDNKS